MATQSESTELAAFGLSIALMGMLLKTVGAVTGKGGKSGGSMVRDRLPSTVNHHSDKMANNAPSSPAALLDMRIRQKRNDSNWERWPYGTASEARKAVYAEILQPFTSLEEARKHAYENELLMLVITDIDRNSWLSPFRAEKTTERWEQPPLIPMIIKCAWCGKYLGEKEPYEDKSETHGICQECLDTYFPEKKAYKIWEDLYDAHRGELYGTLWAEDTDAMKIGRLDFSLYGDELCIRWLEVAEQARHQGIATALVEYLYRHYPDKKVVSSMTTSDGDKFRKSILGKPGLLPFTIPASDLRRIADKYGWWAARSAEAVCPYGDVDCVEREARRLAKTLRARWSDGYGNRT